MITKEVQILNKMHKEYKSKGAYFIKIVQGIEI